MSKDILTCLQESLDTYTNSVRSLGKNLEPEVILAIEELVNIKGKIIVSGIGKSGIIAKKIAATFSSLGISSIFLHPTEALHGDLGVLQPQDALIAISNSGETSELKGVVDFAKKNGIFVLGITSRKESSLVKFSDKSIVYRIDSEGSPHNIAPMASTTVTMIIGDLLAVGIATQREFSPTEFAKLHPSGSLGLKLAVVADIMVELPNIPVIDISGEIKEVLEVMSSGNSGIVGVCKNNMLCGVISDGDIRRALLKNILLHEQKISDVMVKNPKVTVPSETLFSALQQMKDHKISSLFVVEESGNPIGFISLNQILTYQI